LFKYELHSHTSEASKCGHLKAREVVRMYKAAGYQGIVFTDHFNEENFLLSREPDWSARMDRYLEGFRQGSDEGRNLDMDVLWGLELRFTENDNDFLVYGLDVKFLKDHPDLHKSTLREFMGKIAGREDVLVFQAHPFRDGCFPAEAELVHGLEIYNGNPRHDSRNRLARELAREKGLLFLSGSDFHRTEDLASGGVWMPDRIRDIRSLVEQLRRLNHDRLIVRGTPSGAEA